MSAEDYGRANEAIEDVVTRIEKHFSTANDARAKRGLKSVHNALGPAQKPHGNRATAGGGSKQRLMILLRSAGKAFNLNMPKWNAMVDMSDDQVWDVAAKHFGSKESAQSVLDSMGGSGEQGENVNMDDVSDEFLSDVVKPALGGSKVPAKPAKPAKRPAAPKVTSPLDGSGRSPQPTLKPANQEELDNIIDRLKSPKKPVRPLDGSGLVEAERERKLAEAKMRRALSTKPSIPGVDPENLPEPIKEPEPIDGEVTVEEKPSIEPTNELRAAIKDFATSLPEGSKDRDDLMAAAEEKPSLWQRAIGKAKEILDRLVNEERGGSKPESGSESETSKPSFMARGKKAWNNYFKAKKSGNKEQRDEAWAEVEAASEEAGIPDKLPENQSDYFDVEGVDNVEIIPVSSLSLVRPPESQPERVNRAKYLMFAASQGILDKRGPITAYKNPDGTYTVVDGNSTSGAAMVSEWGSIPAQIVDAPKEPDVPAPRIGAGTLNRAVELGQSIKARLFKTIDSMIHPEEYESAPKQDFGSLDSLVESHLADEEAFNSIVLSAADNGVVDYDDAKETAKTDPSGLFGKALLNIKERASANRKVKEKLKGDYNKLDDIVRATVLVYTADQIPEQLEKVRAAVAGSGWKIRGIKNRWASEDGNMGGERPWNVGAVGGYRDVKMQLVSPNGNVMELQLNTAPMWEVKEGPGHKLYEEIRKIVPQMEDILERIESTEGPLKDSLMARYDNMKTKLNQLEDKSMAYYGIAEGLSFLATG